VGPFLPHGNNRKPVTQHQGHAHRGPTGTNHRYIENATKSLDPGIGHGIDTNRVISPGLGGQPRLQNTDFPKLRTIRTAIVARRKSHAFEIKLDVGPQFDGLQLVTPLFAIPIAHWDWNDH
jgi:hypothetical protein